MGFRIVRYLDRAVPLNGEECIVLKKRGGCPNEANEAESGDSVILSRSITTVRC